MGIQNIEARTDLGVAAAVSDKVSEKSGQALGIAVRAQGSGWEMTNPAQRK
jgi:hypothetical protein